MTYLFDTNLCLYLIKKKPVSVVERMRTESIDQIGVSSITLAELEHGVSKSAFPERNRIALVEFVTPFRILEFGQSAAYEYGRLHSRLEQAGQVIGPLDFLIAAHAVAESLTLVTNNERGFQRVPNLKIENWVR